MQVFSVQDVERVLKLPRSAIRALVRSGYVAPTRGNRRQYQFSFQDLVALRTARGLMQASMAPRRITRALKQLRRHLPEALPLSGLRICVSGTDLVVREDAQPWRTPAGQYLLEFEIRIDEGALRIVDQAAPSANAEPHDDADSLFANALSLEDTDAVAALQAYQRCLQADPKHVGARINCGRLLHVAARISEAEALYRAGLTETESDATLLFNFAVLMEDTGRERQAVDLYQRALQEDPRFADAHFNLARLYQRLAVPRAAIRHWNLYRRLSVPPE